MGGSIFIKGWIVVEKMLLLEFLPHLLSCKHHHPPTLRLDFSRVAALEQGVSLFAKPEPDNFVFIWVLLGARALGISAIIDRMDNETLQQY